METTARKFVVAGLVPFIALPPAERSPEWSVCTPGSPPNRL